MTGDDKCVWESTWSVHYLCPVLSRLLVIWANFCIKIPTIKLHKNPSSESRSVPFGQTNTTKQVDTLHMQGCEKTNHNVMHECYLEVFWILCMHNASFYSWLHKPWCLIQ